MVGAGERAALMAEQFAFQQGLGKGRAVHRDHLPGGALAAAMDRAGDQFLAGAGLAGDQDRGIGGTDAGDFFAQRRDCRAAPAEFGRSLQTNDRLAQSTVFTQ